MEPIQKLKIGLIITICIIGVTFITAYFVSTLSSYETVNSYAQLTYSEQQVVNKFLNAQKDYSNLYSIIGYLEILTFGFLCIIFYRLWRYKVLSISEVDAALKIEGVKEK